MADYTLEPVEDTKYTLEPVGNVTSVFSESEIKEAAKAGIYSEFLGIPFPMALENAQEIYDKTKDIDSSVDFSQVTEADLSRPISTITGKPVPTAEEYFKGVETIAGLPGRTRDYIARLIPYGFASFTRGLVPKAAEDAIMQPIIKTLTGHDYVSPITESLKTSGKWLPENIKPFVGTASEMAGIVVPLSMSFNTASAIIKTLGVSEEFLVRGSPILSTMAYNIFRGGIAGAIYEGMESGDTEEMIKTGAFFAALDGVFGVTSGVIKKIFASTWYRKLEIKERDLVIQTATDMRNAGQSEGTILRSLSNKTEREALVKEAIAKRAEGEKPVEVKTKAIRETTGETVIITEAKPQPIVKDYPELKETPSEGYRARGLEDAIKLRQVEPDGSLANYDAQSTREWLRGQTPPADGNLTLYRATPTGQKIKPGDYVTNSLQYAKDHITNNLGGEGKVTSIKATLDDIYPADGPGEFWYAPKSIETTPGKPVPKAKGVSEPTPKTMTADEIAIERKKIESEMADISLKEYEKVSRLASMRALEEIQKSEAKEDRAIDSAARKFAKEMIEASPIYTMINDLKKQGGINYRSLETMGINGSEIAELIKRHPGLVSKEGKIYADKMVDDLGYESISDFVEEVQFVEPKTEAIEKYFNESILETDQIASEIRLEYFYEKILDEEIKVLNEMLGRKPKTRKDLKKVIREKAGIIKISEVLEVKERDALKNQIMFEARAARKAFSEGKREASLAHKERQRELVIQARERTRIRKRINKIQKDLKALNPDKMMPQFGKPIQDILDGIDLTKPTKKTLIKLGARKEFLERNQGYVDMPDKYIEELNRLEKISIRDMSIDELEDLYSAIMLYEKLDKNLKTIKVGRRDRARAEVLSETIGLLKTQKKLEADFVSSQIAGARQVSFKQQIGDFFGLHQQHYNTVLEKLVGINSTPYKVLWTGVKEGVIIKYRVNQKAEDLLNYDAFQKKHKIDDLMKWKTEVIHPEGGMELIRDERVTVWRLAQNPDSLRHMLDGGVGFKFSSRPLDVHKITVESLEKTLDSLTEAELEYAQFPEKVNYFGSLFEEQAEVYLDVNMFPLKQVEGLYHPIEVMPSEIGDIDIGEEPVLLKDQVIRIGIKKGQLIERVKSAKPIYLNPLTYDLNKARDVASKYVGLEKPLREASKLIYSKQFKNELIKRYDNGLEIWKNIEKALKDIAGQNQGHSQMGRWLLEIKNELTTSILGYNPFSYVIQIPSSVLYLTYIKPEYYLRGLQEALSNPKEIFEKHMRYDPEFRERVRYGYERDVMDAVKALEKGKLFDEKKFVSWGMKGLKAADMVAVVPGMQGAVLQALDEFEAGFISKPIQMALDMRNDEIAGLTPDEKLGLAYDFARWCTERTQPMFSPEHRSALSRGAAPYQMLTMFGAYISGARNMIERAAINAQREKTQESYNALVMSLFGVFVLNTLAILARDDLRNYLLKRKQEPWTVGRILRVWTSYVFGLRDIASSVISKLERGTFAGRDPEIPLHRVGEVFTDATTHGLNTMLGPDHKREKNAEKFIDKSIEFFLMTKGIPYRTPKAIITAPFKEREK